MTRMDRKKEFPTKGTEITKKSDFTKVTRKNLYFAIYYPLNSIFYQNFIKIYKQTKLEF